MEITSKVFEKQEFTNAFHCMIAQIINAVPEVDILYGTVWGNDIYGFDNDWIPETIHSEEIEKNVEDKITKEYGNIGEDDLFIKIKDENIEILICHERDLHIVYEVVTPTLKLIMNAIEMKDWHWVRNNENEKWEKFVE
jgi:hypothetical protein